MALTEFQRRVCRLLAKQRIQCGDAYVAGAAALNLWLNAPRISGDLDLFHDTVEAVARTWEQDTAALEGAGLSVRVVIERPGFVRAIVADTDGQLLLEWLRDSAFRFFPLVTHGELGLSLHPFDLATNKVLALIGRLEVRDWIDVIECDSRLQPLGYLAWAACGKDPAFSPPSLLAQASRSGRYGREEIETLAFAGSPPDAAELHRRWHAMLDRAGEIVSILPAEQVGKCVLGKDGKPMRDEPAGLRRALDANEITFHSGSIGGALPQIVS